MRAPFLSRLLCAAALAAAAVSCELSPELSVPLGADTPSSVLWDFQHNVVSKGLPRLRLIADRAESYDTRKYMKLYDVGFAEYAEDASLLTTGRAEYATLYTDTENVELDGVIECASIRDKVAIEARYLYWDSAEKTLKSRKELLVTIRRDDGSSIRGEGFEADGKTREYGFSGSVRGYFELPSDKEE